MNRPIETLYETLDFLIALRESNDIKVWSRMLEKLAAALQAEAATYYFFDTLARQIVPFYRLGGSPGASAAPVPSGEGLCGWVAKFREPLLVAETAGESRYRKDLDDAPGVAARTALCVPLSVNLEFAGVFAFLNKPGGPFTEDDRRFAATACAQAGATIRRLRLEDMVNRVTAYNSSILDNLSGGFLAVDIQGRVMICNPAAKRILSIQGDVTDLQVELALAGLPELAAVLRKTLNSRQPVRRQELRWALAGLPRVLGYSTLVIQDTQGSFTGAGVTFQDITPAR